MFIYGALSSRCAGIGGLRGRGRTDGGRLSCYRFAGPWPPSRCVLSRRVNTVSLALLLYRLTGMRLFQPATLFVCDVRRLPMPFETGHAA
jgi:hypothetical protein